MRIIGGYDYYDTVGNFSKDASDITFVRQKAFTRETKDTHEWITLPKKVPFKNNYLEWHVSTVEVIFCGTYYFGVTYRTDRGIKYYWKYSDLIDDKIDFFDYDWNNSSKELKKRLEEEFVPRKFFDQDALIRNNVVIAVRFREENQWSKNPTGLKEIGFASVVPPWEAYQEIEMFLGTILVNDQSKMVSVSDKSKALKYGFDKYSFRNINHPAKPRSGG